MSEFFHAIDSGSWEKPEVFAIADELQISQGDAFLACLTMWDYFRRNSIDGTVMGVSLRNIDRQVRLPGFAAAAVKAHWLEEIEGGLRQPGFLFHLHGCESLKAYRHRIRAKRSDDKKQLIEALRAIDPDLVAGLETAQENLREKRTKRESKRESKLLRTGPGNRAVPCRVLRFLKKHRRAVAGLRPSHNGMSLPTITLHPLRWCTVPNAKQHSSHVRSALAVETS